MKLCTTLVLIAILLSAFLPFCVAAEQICYEDNCIDLELNENGQYCYEGSCYTIEEIQSVLASNSDTSTTLTTNLSADDNNSFPGLPSVPTSPGDILSAGKQSWEIVSWVRNQGATLIDTGFNMFGLQLTVGQFLMWLLIIIIAIAVVVFILHHIVAFVLLAILAVVVFIIFLGLGSVPLV